MQAMSSQAAAAPSDAPEAQFLAELGEQKDELLTKVQALKTDLQEWRSRLEVQVNSYKMVRAGIAHCDQHTHTHRHKQGHPCQLVGADAASGLLCCASPTHSVLCVL